MAIGAGAAAVDSAAGHDVVADEQDTRERHIQINVGRYAGLLGRACPAGVYEYVPVEGNSTSEGTWNGHELVINSQVGSPPQVGTSANTFPPSELYSLQTL